MRLSTRTITPVAVAAACLFCFSIAEAGKPVKPPGGGGGGGDSATAPFTVIELPGIDIAYKVSQQSVEGAVTVAGGSGSNAAYAVVDVATRLVLADGLLPVPGNVNSDAWDVNSSGTIVGSAGALPMRWERSRGHGMLMGLRTNLVFQIACNVSVGSGA